CRLNWVLAREYIVGDRLQTNDLCDAQYVSRRKERSEATSCPQETILILADQGFRFAVKVV
ncbi:MAG TPA: hypothetical protein PLV20_06835, partial [Anaerolineaceae bacterium]|nr:hypothetical protein [Anaerolineaceae bacterium]